MIWFAIGLAALAAPAARTDAVPADGHFTASELRVLCRGETETSPQFRTQAGYQMMAEYQRARCRMYLLGVADGIGWHQADDRACASASSERDSLGEQLVEAILQPAGPDRSVREIVAAQLIAHPSCR